ncbi:hypothetical protein [Thiolapillus sp.]
MADYFLFGLFLVILPMIICHQIAKRRGSNPVFWAVMGALFGPFAIPFVFFSRPESE